MSHSDYCICCMQNSDLVSVHEELSLQGYIRTHSNAAALVDHCFNIKIVTCEVSYAMCSTCVSKLVQSCILRDQLIHNLNSTTDKKAPDDKLDIVRKNILKSSNIKNSGELLNTSRQLLDKNKSTVYCRIKIHPEKMKDSTEMPAEISKCLNPNKVSIKERRKSLPKNNVKNYKFKTKTENSRLKDEFKSLILNCKDIGIFSWHKSKYKCLVCKELFSDKASFKIHASKHTNEDFGEVCPKGNFYDVPDLKVDISSMKCRHYGECVRELDAFRLHLSVAHKSHADDLLRRILPFKLTEDELECGVCDKVFINMWTLNLHMNEHSTNYICPHCGKLFITFNRMQYHINHLHVTGSFKCTKCDETFESLSKRGYHVAAVHRTVKHLCQYCPETFKAFEHKIRHLAEVHNKELKRYKCESCPAAYITSKNLKTHIRNVHLQERNYSCSECGDSFFSRRELQDHTVKHTGEKQFECQICHKKFGRKRNLGQHIKIHNK